MLRAANAPRGPQDETTADIEVHLVRCAHRSRRDVSGLGDFALNRIVTGFAIETERDHRPKNK